MLGEEPGENWPPMMAKITAAINGMAHQPDTKLVYGVCVGIFTNSLENMPNQLDSSVAWVGSEEIESIQGVNFVLYNLVDNLVKAFGDATTHQILNAAFQAVLNKPSS